MKKTGTMLIITLLVLLAALLVVARVRASGAVYVDPPYPLQNPVWLPWVGHDTASGPSPYRVTGHLEYIWGDVYRCQLIRLAELWYYDPHTGSGYVILDNAFNPGDITDENGFFILDEVLDENGIPYDIATTDHVFIVGRPDMGAEGVAYDIIESPLVFDLYAGQVRDVGTIQAKEVNQYCWADPDSGRQVWQIETVNGEMRIK